MGMGSGSGYDSGSGYYGPRSGSGMGMGMGSGSGYDAGSGYYGNPGYGYQRPPRPPMRPYGYQRPAMPPMRPYGAERPPMPPMRPYGGYRSQPMNPPAAAAESSVSSEAPASSTLTIDIQGMAFQPASVTVKAGAKVTWVNRDGAPHTVTSMDSGPLASGTLNRGASYSMTFDDPGTYTYYCKFHPNMRASIIVE